MKLTQEQFDNLDILDTELKKKHPTFKGFNGSKNNMEIEFMSTGKPVKVSFTATIRPTASNPTVSTVIDVDGTDKISGAARVENDSSFSSMQTIQHLEWLETLSAGVHTIKVQWKTNSSTANQDGATHKRILIVKEL